MRNADGMGGIDGLDGVDADDLESRLVEEEGLEGLDDERGLEETLEKLGFGGSLRSLFRIVRQRSC